MSPRRFEARLHDHADGVQPDVRRHDPMLPHTASCRSGSIFAYVVASSGCPKRERSRPSTRRRADCLRIGRPISGRLRHRYLTAGS
jgi:hypothetical protein